MWDNSTPLQLLGTMPKVLEEEHLEKLQKLLEADKYKNQLISGAELCGEYAPFCDGCDKEIKYPCAVAYVNYLKEQGMDLEIATENIDDENSDSAKEENAVEESKVSEEASKTEEKEQKTKIRIAIARKKTIL